jgi:hypothetical protein
LDRVLVLDEQRVQTEVGELCRLVLDERIVDEDEGWFVLLELRLEPMELFFPEGADAGLKSDEAWSCVLPRKLLRWMNL